ncbi:hypothetical protein Scep_016831 [Stephania cephalantha]|uniref:Uncharacterized protein n=1 Tax=Stephania cephalantha TaxID=152367 RepID=A0AAP0INE8_9MAGN
MVSNIMHATSVESLTCLVCASFTALNALAGGSSRIRSLRIYNLRSWLITILKFLN